jgi:deoxyribose-phosphate aldolase
MVFPNPRRANRKARRIQVWSASEETDFVASVDDAADMVVGKVGSTSEESERKDFSGWAPFIHHWRNAKLWLLTSLMETIPLPPEVLSLAGLIDHAILHPTNTAAETEAACLLGHRWQVATVCVKPCFVKVAAALLRDSGTKVCAVTGFPHANSASKVKAMETATALEDGAREIDTVVNNGLVFAEDWAGVAQDLAAVRAVCPPDVVLKVIFETDYQNEKQIRAVAGICREVGVDYVKTSTGFGFVKQSSGDYNYVGARPEHILAMREAAGPGMGLKASGGIRTLEELEKFRDLGCRRIGTSSTESILTAACQRAGLVLAPPTTDGSAGY